MIIGLLFYSTPLW